MVIFCVYKSIIKNINDFNKEIVYIVHKLLHYHIVPHNLLLPPVDGGIDPLLLPLPPTDGGVDPRRLLVALGCV
jgi:hypothetical protein